MVADRDIPQNLGTGPDQNMIADDRVKVHSAVPHTQDGGGINGAMIADFDALPDHNPLGMQNGKIIADFRAVMNLDAVENGIKPLKQKRQNGNTPAV